MLFLNVKYQESFNFKHGIQLNIDIIGNKNFYSHGILISDLGSVCYSSRDRDLTVAEERRGRSERLGLSRSSFIVKSKRTALWREGGSENGMPPELVYTGDYICP